MLNGDFSCVSYSSLWKKLITKEGENNLSTVCLSVYLCACHLCLKVKLQSNKAAKNHKLKAKVNTPVSYHKPTCSLLISLNPRSNTKAKLGNLRHSTLRQIKQTGGNFPFGVSVIAVRNVCSLPPARRRILYRTVV